MLVSIILASATVPSPADQRAARIAALYDEICLKAFPSDRAVETAMVMRHVAELSPEAVKVTMGKDPARGWLLAEDGVTVWLELPPFHACSVRWNAPEPDNGVAYARIIADYKQKTGPFQKPFAQEADHGDIHIRATAEQRVLPDQSVEALMAIEQSITDPKRRAAGETGYSLRYVHQWVSARR